MLAGLYHVFPKSNLGGLPQDAGHETDRVYDLF